MFALLIASTSHFTVASEPNPISDENKGGGNLPTKEWPLWDGKELPVDYAKRVGVAHEKMIEVKGKKFELVLIPAGKFIMGSPVGEYKRRNEDELQHEVTITKPFYMAKHEVTQEQWQAVMGDNPSEFKGALKPVANVSWDDAQSFLKLAGNSFALPTDAQWEYACRAGTSSTFSYGNFLSPESANFLGLYNFGEGRNFKPLYRETPVDVGSFTPNYFGLYDMHGNVWEWCQDWIAPITSIDPQKDPTGPKDGRRKISRGGSWSSNPSLCRSAKRDGWETDTRHNHRGFRIVIKD